MTERTGGLGPPGGGLPADAPQVARTSVGMARVLAAVTGLALVAVAAFCLIGTQPQSASAVRLTAVSGSGDAVARR
jgi:hypothetical protein